MATSIRVRISKVLFVNNQSLNKLVDPFWLLILPSNFPYIADVGNKVLSVCQEILDSKRSAHESNDKELPNTCDSDSNGKLNIGTSYRFPIVCQLWLDGCLLINSERVEVLRDNDSITVYILDHSSQMVSHSHNLLASGVRDKEKSGKSRPGSYELSQLVAEDQLCGLDKRHSKKRKYDPEEAEPVYDNSPKDKHIKKKKKNRLKDSSVTDLEDVLEEKSDKNKLKKHKKSSKSEKCCSVNSVDSSCGEIMEVSQTTSNSDSLLKDTSPNENLTSELQALIANRIKELKQIEESETQSKLNSSHKTGFNTDKPHRNPSMREETKNPDVTSLNISNCLSSSVDTSLLRDEHSISEKSLGDTTDKKRRRRRKPKNKRKEAEVQKIVAVREKPGSSVLKLPWDQQPQNTKLVFESDNDEDKDEADNKSQSSLKSKTETPWSIEKNTTHHSLRDGGEGKITKKDVIDKIDHFDVENQHKSSNMTDRMNNENSVPSCHKDKLYGQENNKKSPKGSIFDTSKTDLVAQDSSTPKRQSSPCHGDADMNVSQKKSTTIDTPMSTNIKSTKNVLKNSNKYLLRSTVGFLDSLKLSSPVGTSNEEDRDINFDKSQKLLKKPQDGKEKIKRKNKNGSEKNSFQCESNVSSIPSTSSGQENTTKSLSKATITKTPVGGSIDSDSLFQELLQRRKLSTVSCRVEMTSRGVAVCSRVSSNPRVASLPGKASLSFADPARDTLTNISVIKQCKQDSSSLASSIASRKPLGLSESRTNGHRDKAMPARDTHDPSDAVSQSGEAKVEVIPLNPEVCPALRGTPCVGDILGYKILEISEDYTPNVSAFKTGKVLSFESDGSVTLELYGQSGVSAKKKRGKFDLVYEDEDNSELNDSSDNSMVESQVLVPLSSMMDTRLVQRQTALEVKAS